MKIVRTKLEVLEVEFGSLAVGAVFYTNTETRTPYLKITDIILVGARPGLATREYNCLNLETMEYGLCGVRAPVTPVRAELHVAL